MNFGVCIQQLIDYSILDWKVLSMSDREREEFYHEIEETSRRWKEACKDPKTVAEMAERLDQLKEHPGSFESNHGCWEHFRKIC